ncbi:hypothetical protein C8T65DRAFT_694900 [Cerioporus squamosus]|nr:hypothetical protein C8T65DRAFT_694900 [Cerioporus squamosus]
MSSSSSSSAAAAAVVAEFDSIYTGQYFAMAAAGGFSPFKLEQFISCGYRNQAADQISNGLVKMARVIRVQFVLNVLHLVLTVTAVATDNGEGSVVTTFTAPITAILVSRFLLELQEAEQMVVRLDTDDPLHSSRVPYDGTPTFISSLGGFVNPALSTRSEYDSFELEVPSCSTVVEEEPERGARDKSPHAAVAASLFFV